MRVQVDKLIALGAKLELARRNFYRYAQLIAPDFYKPDRTYLKVLCDSLQDFLSSDEDVLVMNLPPRHGKSRMASLFAEWLLGRDKTQKIMIGSYNERVSQQFSKSVRDAIQTEKADDNITVYSDIFPNTRIQYGDSAVNRWSLEGGYNNYLATSPNGSATGFGAKEEKYYRKKLAY